MLIAPSILSADFADLRTEISSVSAADYLHFDVMDGIFVPNISFGVPILESVRRITNLPLDVHLMITRPERLVGAFIAAGADIITIHAEATEKPQISEALTEIKKAGKLAGLVLKPKTPADAIMQWMDMLDIILVMTVEPGFGGQAFMRDMLPKIEELRVIINTRGLNALIEVDGGINPETGKLCAAAGADILVAGSDIFKQKDRAAHIAALKAIS